MSTLCVNPKLRYLSSLVYEVILCAHKCSHCSFYHLKWHRASGHFFLVVPHSLALMHIITSAHWGRLCWRRRIGVLLFHWLSSLFYCPGGVRKTWHCPPMSLIQSISNPLCVTCILNGFFPLGRQQTPIPYCSNQPTHQLSYSPMSWGSVVTHLMFCSFFFLIGYYSNPVSVWSTWILRRPMLSKRVCYSSTTFDMLLPRH